MADSESIKKMLRSVLQSSKSGVSISSLQSEYRTLCGEAIPLKKLGFSKLEDYLRSIPSVVRLDYRMGELKCFAAVCQETAHIAELVARQKNSKKCGPSKVINCKMRFKASNPYMLNVTPRSSLRQPSLAVASNWPANRSQTHGGYRGFSASGDYRQLDQKLSSITPLEHRQRAPQGTVKQNVIPNSLYDVSLVQRRITQLLEKYCSGMWMSKLPEVYSQMFKQKLHPQVLIDIEKWTHICQVEKPPSSNRADRLIYPPLPKPPTVSVKSTSSPTASPINSSTAIVPISSCPSKPGQLATPLNPPPVPKTRVFLKERLAKPNVFSPQPAAATLGKALSSVTLRSPAHNPALAPRLTPRASPPVSNNGGCEDYHNLPTDTLKHNRSTHSLAPTWTKIASTITSATDSKSGHDVLPLVKVAFSPSMNSAPSPPLKSSAVTASAEVRQKIKELLSKYSGGLWAHALPKLFMDTYKMPFPEHVLDNLFQLLDICTVEYPLPHDKNRAILYNTSRADMESTDGQDNQQCSGHTLPSGLEVLSPVVPPCLVVPSEQYPSVLVTEAKSSNAVTIRYVGVNYSHLHEAMEDVMASFYSQSSMQHPLSNPTVGQLVAVRGEDGDDLARAQVIEIMDSNKVKVYYMDYGLSVETSGTNLLHLHQDFLSLPFQATNVRLAGLEAFSSHPSVLSSLDTLAVGKILLMETLKSCEQNEVPVAVLYDTSEEEDLNINSTCLKALQDKTMNNPLTVNVTYKDVSVTNVCADGIMYCQLPSRGNTRLKKLLEQTEVYFISQMTSDYLVARPFSGKFCLARYKGQWARVEITSMHDNRVMEIVFFDFGVPATVEVTDLREIPPLFLKDFTLIPPQAIKCRLAELTVPEGDWSQEAVLWLKEATLGSEDCKMKIVKLDEHKGDKLVYMYLFIGVDSQELHKSINHQLDRSENEIKLLNLRFESALRVALLSTFSGLSALMEQLTLNNPVTNPTVKASAQPCGTKEEDSNTKTGMPPPLELPQLGQNMDVFVPVACHPGYFVLQPWQDLHKLVVLMGEMMLYYNQTGKTNTVTQIQKREVYAAKIDKNWHRVQVKAILANGLVSVYELDHGKHELVRSTLIRPLIEEFRQLPFQAIAAQLAGVAQQQWSEEASMLFRNHVEKRALVAQVESVHQMSEVKGELWACRLTVYLVDTTMEDRDLWIHSIMTDINGELSSAA
uniref:Tudor domain-containing protein 7 n=1 Tax=Amphiprion ocellaris TaxID=80972 RepID=A0AAQ5XR84_AMPOC